MKKKAVFTSQRDRSSAGEKPRLLDLFCCAGGAGVGYDAGADKELRSNSMRPYRKAMWAIGVIVMIAIGVIVVELAYFGLLLDYWKNP